MNSLQFTPFSGSIPSIGSFGQTLTSVGGGIAPSNFFPQVGKNVIVIVLTISDTTESSDISSCLPGFATHSEDLRQTKDCLTLSCHFVTA